MLTTYVMVNGVTDDIPSGHTTETELDTSDTTADVGTPASISETITEATTPILRYPQRIHARPDMYIEHY